MLQHSHTLPPCSSSVALLHQSKRTILNTIYFHALLVYVIIERPLGSWSLGIRLKWYDGTQDKFKHMVWVQPVFCPKNQNLLNKLPPKSPKHTHFMYSHTNIFVHVHRINEVKILFHIGFSASMCCLGLLGLHPCGLTCHVAHSMVLTVVDQGSAKDIIWAYYSVVQHGH